MKKGPDDRDMEDRYPTSRENVLLDTDTEENYDPTQEVSSVKDHGTKDADATQVS